MPRLKRKFTAQNRRVERYPLDPESASNILAFIEPDVEYFLDDDVNHYLLLKNGILYEYTLNSDRGRGSLQIK